MDRQHKVIYAERREVLEGKDLKEQIRGFLDDTVAGYVNGATEDIAEQWDLEALWNALRQIYPVGLDHEAIVEEAGGVDHVDRDELIAALQADARAAYDAREQEIGEPVMRELERRVVLSVLDRKWREHLYEMDYLREGIYLRAYSQRDPLVEYQREGFDMFSAMMDGIKEESVGFLFNLDVQVEEEPEGEVDFEVEAEEPVEPMARSLPSAEQPSIRARGLERPATPQKLAYSAPSEVGGAEVKTEDAPEDEFAKVGRNDKCPCGSGKKYKQCHGRPGGPTGLTARVS
jgi:preprotein translocase subunit SecA